MSTTVVVILTAVVTFIVLCGVGFVWILFATEKAWHSVRMKVLMMFILYCVDVTCAISGFVYGFGIEIRSWWWVLGMMFLGRFVLFFYNTILGYAMTAPKEHDRSYWDAKAEERREEFKREAAEDRERAYPERRPG